MAIKTGVSDANEATPTSALSSITEIQKMGLGTLNRMGTTWFENMSDIGSEVMSFVADRVKEDVKTQHAILHCKDAEQLRKIQTEFMQKAVDQYTAETGKLVEMGNGLMSETQFKNGS